MSGAGQLVFDTERIARWMDDRLGTEVGAPVSHAIGYELNRDLVAAVCFDGMLENSVQAHIVSVRPLLPYPLLVAVARYAFVQCDVERLTFYVPSRNERALRLVEHMGAKPEGCLARAMKDGDVLIFVLWRDAPFSQKCLSMIGVAA